MTRSDAAAPHPDAGREPGPRNEIAFGLVSAASYSWKPIARRDREG
ncbi:hypothetical protein H180DRAFT_03378 [Streptomyces sp. WMMB 322]|nr:hypothetical protein H180DRAFT_03378 [Streptomyces sp. WMMB 322]